VNLTEEATLSVLDNGKECGAAVFISGAGHALTATHLLFTTRASVRFRDGREASIRSTTDLGDDLSLIRIAERPVPYLRIAQPVIGNAVFMSGHPKDEDSRITLGARGHYVGTYQAAQGPTCHRFETALQRGYSGSAVVDIASGNLVSIITDVQNPGNRSKDFGLHALGARLDAQAIERLIIEDFLRDLHSNNLPSAALLSDLRSGFCRNKLFRQIAEQLDRDRIVFVHGAPGVGKTFAAIQILLDAWEHSDRALAFVGFSDAEADVTEANLNLSSIVREHADDTLLVIDDPWPRNVNTFTQDLIDDLERVLRGARCQLLVLANDLRGGQLFPQLAPGFGVPAISMTCESAYEIGELTLFAQRLMHARFDTSNKVAGNVLRHAQTTITPFDIRAAVELAATVADVRLDSTCRQLVHDHITRLDPAQRIAWAVLALAADHSVPEDRLRKATIRVQRNLKRDAKVSYGDPMIAPFVSRHVGRAQKSSYWWPEFQHEHYREALFSYYFAHAPQELVSIIHALVGIDDNTVARIAIVRSLQWPQYLSIEVQTALEEVAAQGTPVLRAAIGRGIIDNWTKLPVDLRQTLSKLLPVVQKPVPEWLAWRLACNQANKDFWQFDDWLLDRPSEDSEKSLWTAEGFLAHVRSLRRKCSDWLLQYASDYEANALYATAYILGRLGNAERPHTIIASRDFVDIIRLASTNHSAMRQAEREVETRRGKWPADRAYWTWKALHQIPDLVRTA